MEWGVILDYGLKGQARSKRPSFVCNEWLVKRAQGVHKKSWWPETTGVQRNALWLGQYDVSIQVTRSAIFLTVEWVRTSTAEVKHLTGCSQAIRDAYYQGRGSSFSNSSTAANSGVLLISWLKWWSTIELKEWRKWEQNTGKLTTDPRARWIQALRCVCFE